MHHHKYYINLLQYHQIMQIIILLLRILENHHKTISGQTVMINGATYSYTLLSYIEVIFNSNKVSDDSEWTSDWTSNS